MGLGEEKKERGDIATRFKVGNQAWKARSSHGRKPTFASADSLWDACCEYFDWIDENPELVTELVKFQGEAQEYQVPRRRNMSLDGLITFLDIVNSTWLNYRERPDFLIVTERVDRIIRTHKMDGAISGQFKENIIARELGLAEKKEVDVSDSAYLKRLQDSIESQ